MQATSAKLWATEIRTNRRCSREAAAALGRRAAVTLAIPASLERGDVTKVPVPDELIMALADGELTPSVEARVRAAVNADSAARRKFEIYAGSRRLLENVFDGVLSEPVPERLKQTVARKHPNVA